MIAYEPEGAIARYSSSGGGAVFRLSSRSQISGVGGSPAFAAVLAAARAYAVHVNLDF